MSGLITAGRILALDLATKTGYAWSTHGRLRTSGIVVVSPADDKRQMWRLAGDAIGQMLRYSEPVVVYYEKPMGVFPSWDSTHVMHGLTTILEAETFAYGTRLVGVPQPTLKKFATCSTPGCEHKPEPKRKGRKARCTGSGKAKKPEMILAARRRWPVLEKPTLDDNEADALCLLAYAIEKEGSAVEQVA